MNLINTLRMYAEDMHSATGYSERSSAMSKAADYIEQLEQERDQLAAQNEAMRTVVESLWDIIDDIDTYGDMAKEDDKLFRSLVERRQKDRWKTGITTDGYSLDLHIPNLAADVLKRRDAETLRRAADRFEAVDPHPKHWDWLRRNSAEIDGKETT